ILPRFLRPLCARSGKESVGLCGQARNERWINEGTRPIRYIKEVVFFFSFWKKMKFMKLIEYL
ncbi:MAG: hypothetical protein ACI33P_09745, partial [Lysinibacillus sp.]